MNRDIYQEITDKILKQMEKGDLPWHPSWKSSGNFSMPLNGATGQQYHGVNVLSLWMKNQEMGYDSNLSYTYNQAQEKKLQVRKGKKGTQIVFYKPLEVQKDGKVEEIPMIRYSTVFNACQMEGYKPTEKEQRPLIDRLEHVDEYILNTGVSIYHDGGNRAFYSRVSDDIHLPARDTFKDTESLYSVTLHETIHWSGAPHRLNRVKGKRFGDKEYAYEELVAELGAAFECSKLEITNEPREDHAAYLANWLEVLKNDKKAIFTAASEASKAVEYLDSMQHKVVTADFAKPRA